MSVSGPHFLATQHREPAKDTSDVPKKKFAYVRRLQGREFQFRGCTVNFGFKSHAKYHRNACQSHHRFTIEHGKSITAGDRN